MKKAFWFSFLGAVALGTGWHFLYIAAPCPLTALLAPVNESVWEHLKLLFYPPLLCALVLSFRWNSTRRTYWSGALAGIASMPVLLLGLYYPLTAGFFVPAASAFNIILYVLVLLCGWALGAHLINTGRADRFLGALVILAGVFWAALTVFTAAAPPLPIFISK